MIFFEGFEQLYRVEELSAQKAKKILIQQEMDEPVIEETIEQLFNQTYSFRANCKPTRFVL